MTGLLGRVSELARRAVAHRVSVVGINRRNLTLVYPHNPRHNYPYADDKLLAKRCFERAGVPSPETLAVCQGLFAVPSVVERLRGKGRFVVKPANGSGGAGILVVDDWDEPAGGWRRAGGQLVTPLQLQRHLGDVIFGVHSNQLEDQAFVERRVVPHPFFSTLWGDGLCDIRVITLRTRPVLSMIRVPTAESGGRANLHQGGLGIALDLVTGRTTRAIHRACSIETHPESGARLVGLQVPRWDEVLDVARRAAGSVPLGYLGIDVVLDVERGPLVLEINARPGLEIQNINARGLGSAMAVSEIA